MRVSSARQETQIAGHEKQIDEHGKRLDGHDELHRKTAEKLAGLATDFFPRREADLALESIRDSQQRQEQYLRYIVLGERPKPPADL